MVLALIGVPMRVLAASLPIHLAANMEDGPGLGPCTHMGDLKDAPSPWLQTGPPVTVAIWKGNQQTESLSLDLPISLCVNLLLTLLNSNLQIKKANLEITVRINFPPSQL